MGKKGKPEGGANGAGGQLLLVGALLFVVAWFVPVYKGQDMFGSLPGWLSRIGAPAEGAFGSLEGPDWLPGWNAFQFAWQMLTSDPEGPARDDRWKVLLLGSTCLTNAAMMLSLLLVAARACRGTAALGCGVLLLGCAAVDASWLYLCEREWIESYRAGYYLWLGSFLLVGLGALANVGKR